MSLGAPESSPDHGAWTAANGSQVTDAERAEAGSDRRGAARSWATVGGALALAALAIAAVVAVLVPSSLTDPSGIAGDVLATYPVDGPLDVRIGGGSDVQFDKITLAPNASEGWHAHNGYVLVAIASGTATFYDADDPTCTAKRLSAGQGIVEVPHHVHITRNEGPTPLVLWVASMTPHGTSADIDEPRPGNCPF